MRKTIIAAACAFLTLSGCGSSDKSASIQGVNNNLARDMNAARSEFEKAEDPPVKADTHFAAGQYNETQGQLQLAVEQYQEALKLNPNHVQSLYRLGLVYSQSKQYADAIAIWNRYIAATKNSAVGYSNLAYCQELSGDATSAENSYKTGISRDPRSQPCRVNYGLMLARQGRIDDAKQQFGAVLTPAQVHYNLASVYQTQGKMAEARAEYQEAIKADPKFVDAQTRLAELDKN
jgi:tetratricopeptide (TPR) repeat protein